MPRPEVDNSLLARAKFMLSPFSPELWAVVVLALELTVISRAINTNINVKIVTNKKTNAETRDIID